MRSSERATTLDLGAVVAREARFSMHGELGRGASGIVYDVLDHHFSQRVALKIFFSPDRLHGQLERQFVANPPLNQNLVRILSTGSLENHPYYTMERIIGRDLVSGLRSRTKPLDFDALRSAFGQLVLGLEVLHERGFVHRDLKPSNVLIDDNGRVVVLDLDIACAFGEASTSPSVVGTLAYMSPEQLRGDFLQPCSDFYALGVMLFETLSGQLPQSGDRAARSGTPEIDFTRLPSSAPEDLLDVCRALLAAEPHHRPAACELLRMFGAREARVGPRLRLPEAALGRVAQMAVLHQSFARTQQSGAWVHFEGPLGRGKTSLVAAFLRELASASADAAIVQARFDVHAHSPYGALDSLVQQLTQHGSGEPRRSPHEHEQELCLAEMFPCVRPRELKPGREGLPIDPHERRLRGEAALRSLLMEIGARAPLVIFLDDVHYASPDAARIIQHWMSFPAPKGVLLITCSEHAPWTSVLRGEINHIPLPALSPEESSQLVAQTANYLFGANSRAVFTDVATHEAREPWALLELLRARAQGVLERDPLAAMRARLEALADRDRHVLELLCVARRNVSYEELARAAVVEEADVAHALHTLSEAAWIDWDARTRVAEAHARVASTVYRSLPRERKRGHHARWLLVCQALGDNAAFTCFEHARRAGQPEARGAAGLRAARLARKHLAFGHAARLARAAQGTRLPAGLTSSLARELGDLFCLAGDNARATSAYLHAEKQATTTASRVELARLRARLLLRQGDIDTALKAAHEVLALVGLELPQSTPRVVASLLWNRALVPIDRHRFRATPERQIAQAELARVDALWSMATLFASTDVVRGAELTARSTRRALSAGEPQRAARALLNEALSDVISESPPFARARRRIREAARLTGSEREPSLDAYVRMAYGIVHFFAGEPREGLTHLDAAEERFSRHTQDDLNQVTARQFGVQCLLMSAQARQARVRTELYLQQAEARGDLHAVTLLTAVGVVPALLFTEDDPDSAREVLRRAMAIWPRGRVYMQHLNELIAELVIMEYERRPGMLAKTEQRVAERANTALFRAPPVRAVLACFKAYACIVEAENAHGSEQRRWIEITRAALRKLSSTPIGFAQRRAIQLAPQLFLLEGNLEAAKHATERARTEFLHAGQDVNWTDVILGSLEGGHEGKLRVSAARERMSHAGYRNLERAFGAAGCGLLR